MNEHEVAQVDDASDALPGDEDRIFPIDRIGERDEPPDQAHIPEGCGNTTFCMSFRGNPLDDPTHKKGPLSEESDDQPDGIECHGRVGADGDVGEVDRGER